MLHIASWTLTSLKIIFIIVYKCMYVKHKTSRWLCRVNVSLIGNLFEQITCFRHYSTVQPCYPEEKTDVKDLNKKWFGRDLWCDPKNSSDLKINGVPVSQKNNLYLMKRKILQLTMTNTFLIKIISDGMRKYIFFDCNICALHCERLLS